MWAFSPVSWLLLRRGTTRLLRHTVVLAVPLVAAVIHASLYPGGDPTGRRRNYAIISRALAFTRLAAVAVACAVVFAALRIVFPDTYAPSVLHVPLALAWRDIRAHGRVSATALQHTGCLPPSPALRWHVRTVGDCADARAALVCARPQVAFVTVALPLTAAAFDMVRAVATVRKKSARPGSTLRRGAALMVVLVALRLCLWWWFPRTPAAVTTAMLVNLVRRGRW